MLKHVPVQPIPLALLMLHLQDGLAQESKIGWVRWGGCALVNATRLTVTR